MKKRHVSLTITLTLLLAFSTMGNRGCMNLTTTAATDAALPDLIGVEIGKTFFISLKSNPSTGYSWQPEFDGEYLELVKSTFVSDTNPDGPPLVGAGGIEIFEFLALEQGQTKVTMLYKRVWEQESIDEHIALVQILPTTAKPSTVKQVSDSIRQLVGQVVVINGEFRGWDVGDNVLGTPITRSDWGIKDETGTIYVTGGTGGLKPIPPDGDVGKLIRLVALVKKQGESNVYFLRALEVHVRE